MKYEMNFGSAIDASKLVSPGSGNVMRIAVLGDFGGRSNAGALSIGDELAARKPHRVDVDNLDDVIERFGINLSLTVSDVGGAVNVKIGSMEDFHPDELVAQLPVFEKLANLRKKLQDSSSFAAAAKAVQSLLGQSAIDKHHSKAKKSFGTSIPNRRIDGFSDLINTPSTPVEATPMVDLLKQVMGSHVVAAENPQQEQMLATVDEAISATMRNLLHHPDFQAMESLWRSVELLVRRLDLDQELQVVLYDVTAEELAADVCSSEKLEDTGLFRLLVEQPSMDAQQGELSVLVGSYVFDQSPPHADILGRIAKIASAAHAPFISSISNECLKKQSIEEIHPLVTQSWTTLRELSQSRYLMLTAPRFLLRWPYGKKTDPIDEFEFEEFTRKEGVSGMLWANSCFLAGLLLGETFSKQGRKAMELGSIMTLDDMPFYYYVDEHGDQVALPCTDRLLSERMASFVVSQNFAPVLGIKGRPEVRLGSFKSLFGESLAGPWNERSEQGQDLSAAPPAVSGTAEPVEADGFDDLDDLLNDLGVDDQATAASEQTDGNPEEAATSDDAADDPMDDLDALLADLDAPAEETEADMDDDLSALLADL